METLWPQVERLLLGVAKPARYIGGEQGAQYPEHGPGKVAWMLLYPDTYEIGLPNQGLQILYEILNERPDAVAERAYAPWVDMEAAMREAGVPLFSVEQHVAARDFDVLAFNLSAELVYTNLAQPARPGRGAAPRRRPGPGGPLGHRRRPLRLQPRAPGRLRRRLRPGRRRGDRGGDQRGPGGLAGPAGGGARPRPAAPGPGRDRRGLRPRALHLDLSRRPPRLHRPQPARACRPKWPSGRWPTWPTGPTRPGPWCR